MRIRNDQTPSLLATLSPPTRIQARTLIYELRNFGVPAIITRFGARRTLREQSGLVGIGKSRTINSDHITGRAFDLDVAGWNRSDIPKWFWDTVGPWAERELGLNWGGRWHNPYDPGHFATRLRSEAN